MGQLFAEGASYACAAMWLCLFYSHRAVVMLHTLFNRIFHT